MFLQELLPPEDWDQYKAVLGEMHAVLMNAVDLFASSWRDIDTASARASGYAPASVLMLARHACESFDGVAVLANEGSALACKPLLRSGFEAYLSVRYILQDDAERRGLAYQVGHVHRKIKMYRRADVAHEEGKQLRAALSQDPTTAHVVLPPLDYPALVENLKHMLTQPEFVPIESEWQRIRAISRQKRDPKWYSLFGGPDNLASLAVKVSRQGAYELAYRQWSDAIHVGDALDNLAGDREGPSGSVVMRPLRHPEGLQALVQFATCLLVELTHLVVHRYGGEASQHNFVANERGVRQALLILAESEKLEVPWK